MTAGPANSFGSPAPQPSNTMGLIGFVLSLIGLATCGITAPLGLILSLIGLRGEPKTFAIIGSILGALGTVSFIVVMIAFGAPIIACIGFGAAMQPMIETEIALEEAKTKIDAKKQGDLYPSQAEGDAAIQGSVDYWKTQIRYEPRDGGYLVRSAGADKKFDTDDDLTSDGSQVEPNEDFELDMGEAMPGNSTSKPPSDDPGIEGIDLPKTPPDSEP